MKHQLPPAPMFYVKFPDKTSGPFTIEQLQKLIRRGRVTSDHLISKDGEKWEPAATNSALDFTLLSGSEDRSEETPSSYCPRCSAPIAASAVQCPDCGYDFAAM